MNFRELKYNKKSSLEGFFSFEHSVLTKAIQALLVPPAPTTTWSILLELVCEQLSLIVCPWRDHEVADFIACGLL